MSWVLALGLLWVVGGGLWVGEWRGFADVVFCCVYVYETMNGFDLI